MMDKRPYRVAFLAARIASGFRRWPAEDEVGNWSDFFQILLEYVVVLFVLISICTLAGR